MRGFLSLSFCVAALSFTFQDFSLSNAGKDIASAFSSHELLSFDPVKASRGYELQDAASCQNAWFALAGMLNNKNDTCNNVIQVFQGLQNASWTDGAVAAYLFDFCNNGGGACLQKYQQAYDYMIGECGAFTPYVVSAFVGNETDRLARTIKALVNATCLSSPTPYAAPEYVDPIMGNPMPPFEYEITFCWLHFKWLLSVNLDTVEAADLDIKCSDCAMRVTNWLTKYGVNQLALAARQARAFCDKKKDPDSNAPVYCAPKLKALRQAAMDPNFMTDLKADNAKSAQALATFCHPCVKWGFQLALEVQQLLIKYTPGFNTTYRDQLKSSADALAVTCVRDVNEKYCMAVLSKYTFDTLITMFQPCLLGGCLNKTNPDPCAVVIYALYREVGCCLSSFVRGLKYATGSAAAAGQAVPAILDSCGFKDQVPTTCSQKKVIAHFPLRNIAHAYVQQMAVKDSLPLWFASNLGIDAGAISNVTCWEANATTKTTSCDVHFFPDSSAAAMSFVDDFNYNVANGLQYLAEFDIVSLQNSSDNGGAHVDQGAEAYQATDFSAEVATDCLNFKPPVAYTLNTTSQMCVPICANGVKDGYETGVDCGGMACGPCGQDQECNSNMDCDQSSAAKMCVEVCSTTCKKVCTSGVAALLANPLVLLVGAFLALFLL